MPSLEFRVALDVRILAVYIIFIGAMSSFALGKFTWMNI